VSVFANLVGERINGILLNEDKDFLVVRTINGREFYYYTSGDCCNSVWINHMTGLNVLGEGNTFDLLRGALVTGTEDKGWTDDRYDEDEYDVIQDGFFTLKTDRGYIDFEVRNSHNGYYGGSFESTDTPPRQTDFKAVTEDF
jgi:hypothetical protein